MAAPPPAGYVRLTSSDPPLSVTCRLGEDAPDVTSGYGGWEEVTRPNRPPITTYRAPTGLHLTLSLLLDGWADGRSVEKSITTLRKMAEPRAADGATPRIILHAKGQAIMYTARTWVVGELAWGEALANTQGIRTRQALTLTLYEYVRDKYLTEKSAARRVRNKARNKKAHAGAGAKRVVAKAHARKLTGAAALTSTTPSFDGEDLLSIAARELGDADRWVEIAQLNGLRDPRAITLGQVIRLP